MKEILQSNFWKGWLWLLKGVATLWIWKEMITLEIDKYSGTSEVDGIDIDG